MTTTAEPRLYDEGGDELMSFEQFADRVSLLPGEAAPIESGQRIRILWGQDMLRDVLDGRYRAIVCGVNDEDNSHGIIAQIVNLVTTSQWSVKSVTSYAKVFHDAVSIHAAGDNEPYVLKYDLDSLLVLALLRPKGRTHFTMQDFARGLRTVVKMIGGRRERVPIASVSFLGARSNRLQLEDGSEPSFESVLRIMYDSGFRGDVYPSPTMWRLGNVGVFPTYPFPAGVSRMREGSS